GQLVFVPLLALVVTSNGWRTAVSLMAVVVFALALPILLLVRNRPADLGLRPYGIEDDAAASEDRREAAATTPLRAAAGTTDFWLLVGSFFICGFTANGLIGTHLIPHAVDHGFTEVTAASAVALMGTMNIVGTLASGWLTDRFDNRRLLAV